MDNGSMRAKACSARISLRRRGDNVKHPFGNRRRIAYERRLFFGAKLLFIPHQILVNDSILRRKDRLWPQGTPSGGRQSLLRHIN